MDQSITPNPDSYRLETRDLDAFLQNYQHIEQLSVLYAENQRLQTLLEGLDAEERQLQCQRTQARIAVAFEEYQRREQGDWERRQLAEIAELYALSLRPMQSDVQGVFLDEIKEIQGRLLADNNQLYQESFQHIIQDIKEQYERQRQALERKIYMLEVQLSKANHCKKCAATLEQLKDVKQRLRVELERNKALYATVEEIVEQRK